MNQIPALFFTGYVNQIGFLFHTAKTIKCLATSNIFYAEQIFGENDHYKLGLRIANLWEK